MSVRRGLLARLEEIQSRMPSVTSEEAYAQMEAGRRASERPSRLDLMHPLSAPSRLRDFAEEKYRAQCKDALRKGRELPLLPATQGWLSW